MAKKRKPTPKDGSTSKVQGGGFLVSDAPPDHPEDAHESRQAVGQPTIGNVPRVDMFLAELDSLKDLPDGWNSYSAPAPHPVAIRNAKELVVEAGRMGTEPEHVGPSAMGGAGVTFSAGDREVVIEFYNDGSAHALFADDATEDMSTHSVKTDRDGYREIVGEARKYLHGEKTAP